MLNDLILYNDAERMTVAVYDAKEIFGENAPYTTELKADGKVVIFNTHFITCLREALSTGCMAKMDTEEEIVFQQFVKYQSGASYRDITLEVSEVMEALDAWLIRALDMEEQPQVNVCYDAPTHTWLN